MSYQLIAFQRRTLQRVSVLSYVSLISTCHVLYILRNNISRDMSIVLNLPLEIIQHKLLVSRTQI